MGIISKLKRAGYVGAATALVVTAMPVGAILPWSGVAYADGGASTCVTNVDNPVALLDGCGYDGLDAIFTKINNDVGSNIRHAVTLQQDTTAGGYKIQSRANFVFDLNGHTLTMGDQLVGSTGTETQNWQLLKGSNIEFRNGKIVASNNAQMLIQNYANLTLRNVELDGTPMTSGGSYTLSNNNGTVQIVGSTSIKAGEYNYAFDACWAPNKGYPDGTQVTVDTTGEIVGIVQVDLWGAMQGSGGVLTSLNIKNGNFTGKFDVDTRLAEAIKIEGGTFKLSQGSLAVAEGKVAYKNADGAYIVADAPDMSNVPQRMFAKVGEATAVVGLPDELLAHSTVSVTRLGTFAEGKVTANGVGTFDVNIKPEIYKKNDNGEMVRDESYDKTVKVHSYNFNDVNVVLPVGNEETLSADTVSVDATYDKYEYSVVDNSVATIDENGKIVAVGSGETDIKANVSIKSIPGTYVDVTIGKVYVYDFDSIEETYLVKKDGKAKILADSTWDLIATTTAQNVSIAKSGNNFKINGLSAGLATVDFVATIGGEEKTKSTNVYVYEVNGQDVIVRKGETVGDSDIEALINKGHDDVTMRVKKIENGSGEVSNDSGLALTGVEAGESVVTYRLAVGANDAHANVPVTVHVWDFVTENLADVYDLGDLQTTTDAFKVYDNGGTISYTVKDESGAEVDDVVVNLNGDEYTVTKADDARAGEYLVTFTDTVMGEEVASKTIAVRIHEITVSDEGAHYIVMTRNPFAQNENRYEVNASEFSGFSRNRDIVATVMGSTLDGVTVEYRHGGNWRITAQNAGSYEVTFSDGVASKTVTVYVMQFTFGQDSYHVKREDGEIVINAINNYWQDVNRDEGRNNTKLTIVNDENGNVVAETEYDFGSRELTDSDRYKFEWCVDDNCLSAGNYRVIFEAYANGGEAHGGKTATKSIRLHIYEMVAPQEDLYFMEIGDSLTIDVDDVNDRAYTRAEIVSGPAGGLSFATTGFWLFAQTDYSRLNATLPGVYTVRYTDYMGNGNVVDTYEATIVVVEVEEEELFVQRGEIVNITGSEDWSASFAVDSTTGADYEVEGGVITFDTTGMDLGEHDVYIAHDFAEFDDGDFPPRELVKVTTVVVYEVVPELADDMETDADRASVAGFVAGKIAAMLENDSTDDEQVVLYVGIDELKDMLRDGEEITTELELYPLDKEDWEWAEAYDEVVLKIEDESGIVAMYEAYLVVYADGRSIGLVYELDDAITMRLEVPEEYRDVPDGYTRTFYVVRGHLAANGTETAEVIEVTCDGNYLVFQNNKFSSFAITYADVLNPVTPDTGFVTGEGGSATASVLASVMVMATLALMGAVVFAKRK